jgi:hypothetical protein
MNHDDYLKFVSPPSRWGTYLFQEALNKHPRSADVALLASVSVLVNINSLIPVGIACQHQADPNLYVLASNSDHETFHLLAYVVEKHRRNPFLGNLVNLLLSAGANPQVPVRKELPQGETVELWLKRHSAGLLLQTRADPNNDLLLDRSEANLNRPGSDVVVIKAFDRNLLRRITVTTQNQVPFKIAFMCYNELAWNYLLNQGQLPNYFLVSGFLHVIRSEVDSQRRDVQTQMIIRAVSAGLDMDREQLAILNLYPELAARVIEAYNHPFWEKVCSTNSNVNSRKLIELADTLELKQYETRQICDSLRNPETWNPDTIRKARISQLFNRDAPGKIGTPQSYQTDSPEQHKNIEFQDVIVTDLMNTGPSTGVCANRLIDGSDPLNKYNSSNIVSFTDLNDNTYCFTPENFKEILATRKNPYTGLELPKPIIEQIAAKERIYVKLERGHELSELSPQTKDVLDDTYSFAAYNQLPKEYLNLNYQQILELLKRELTHIDTPQPYSEDNLKYALGRWYVERY